MKILLAIMLSFTTAQPLAQAVASIDARTPLGSVMSSAEWAKVPVELRQAAFFSAGVTSQRFLDELKRRIQQRLRGERDRGGDGVLMDRSLFVKEMREVAQRMGITTGEGGLTDPGSERRLRLIWDTQMRMAQGYARLRAWNDPFTLNLRPAAELRRVSPRRVPRDWPTRWEEAIDRLGDDKLKKVYQESGRMVALINHPIWAEISRFGNPYEPFDFNSGMGMRRIRRGPAERLGLVDPEEEFEPADLELGKVEFALPKSSRSSDEKYNRSTGRLAKTEAGKVTLDTNADGQDVSLRFVTETQDKEIVESWNEILALVNQIHGDGVLKTGFIAKLKDPSNGNRTNRISDGKFVPLFSPEGELYGSKILLRNTDKITLKRSALEEFAHHLDLYGFGLDRRFGSSLDLSEIVSELKKTNTFEAIQASELKLNDKNYLSDDQEVFARFYVQFIAQETRDSDLLEHIRIFNESSDPFQMNQFWDGSEIAPIKIKFMRVLQRKGWVRDR